MLPIFLGNKSKQFFIPGGINSLFSEIIKISNLPYCTCTWTFWQHTLKYKRTEIDVIFFLKKKRFFKRHALSSHTAPGQNEPRHDKTNKMSVRPAGSQISLGIRPV